MGTPIPTDGQQMLRQLVKDVDRLKRTTGVLRTVNAETGVATETIYLSQPNVTEGAVFYQDVELMAESAAVGQAPGDGETILPPEKLWVVVPSDPICSTNQQAVSVTWDGKGAGDEAIPATTFGVLEIHRSLDVASDADPGGSTLVGVMTYPGTVVFTNQMYDVPYYYRFVLVTADYRRSGQSNPVPGLAALIGSGDIDGSVFDDLQQDTLDQAALDAQARADAAVIIANDYTDLQSTAALNAAKDYTDDVVVGASGNTITMSLNDATGTPKDGDLWFKTDGTGKIIKQWVGAGGAWTVQRMSGAVLTDLIAGTITSGTLDAARIGANTITGDKIVAGTLTVAHTAGLQTQLDAKTTTFAQTGVPTSVAVGDIWIDTDDNNKQYRAASVGADQIAAGEWVLVEPVYATVATYAQPGIPVAVNAGDIWVDTDDGNKMYRAAIAGADIISAGEWVLLTTPSTKTFAQPGIPVSVTVGDLWVDTDDNNKMYRAASVGADQITAGEWVLVEPTVATTVTFAQPGVPTSSNAGDLWFDTDDGNKQYRAAAPGVSTIGAGAWVLVASPPGATTVTFAQPSIPVSLTAGDIWVDTDDNNKMYRAAIAGADQIVAGEWVYVSPTVVTVQTFAQTSPPTSVNAGDLWVDTDDSNKMYRAAVAGATTVGAGQWVLVGTSTTTFAQTAIPTALTAGDIWIDTDDSNKMYRAAVPGANTIAAGAWVLVQQTTITFAQPSIPTSVYVGDLWIDTDDGNKMYRAAAVGATTIAAGQWVLVTSTVVTTQTFAQPSIPTAVNAGDLWIDTDDANKMYRATAAGVNSVGPTGWVLLVQSTFTFAQPSIPTSLSVGDLWTDTDDGNKMYRAASVGANEIVAGEWVLIDNTQIANTAATVDGWKYLGGTYIDGGDIQTDTVTAMQIAANSIRAKQMVLADTSNFAEINESYVLPTLYNHGHVIVAGWSARAVNTGAGAGNYFMFRSVEGPCPLKTGDRIRITFEAYAEATVTPSVAVWGYGAVNVSTFMSGNLTVTTTPTAFAVEITLTGDWTNKQTFVLGMSSASMDGKNVYVRNVRAYLMGAGELIVDGSISAKHIGAQSITAEKIALGTYSTNLVADPSFEEPYPIIAVGEYHQWITKDMVAGGYVQRFNLPNSGLMALRLGAAASGDQARVRSGVFPVVPGKVYTVSMALAKEKNVSVAGFYCRLAGGATKDLTEYPAGPFQSYIAFGGADPNAFENFDPIWVSQNLFPYDTTVDVDVNNVYDGAVAWNTGTITTGARSVTTAGQVLTAAALAVAARWGMYADNIIVTPNVTHRITARYTGLAGTNTRFALIIHGVNLADAGAWGQIAAVYSTGSGAGSVSVNPPAGNYDTYRVYTWLENTSATVATANSAVTITSIEMEKIDAVGMPDPVLEQYERKSGSFTVPAGINYMALRLSCTGATAAQSIFVDDVSVVEVGKGGSELTAAGLRLFGADGTEVGAFVSNRPDYLTISDGRDTLAGISQVGVVSGQSFTVAGQDTDGDGKADKGLEIFGTEFLDWLDMQPKGVVTWENFGADNASLAVAETGYGEVGFVCLPGRMYKISVRSMIENNSDAAMSVRLRMTYIDMVDDDTKAPDPKISSPLLLQTNVQPVPIAGMANDDWPFNDWTLLYNETVNTATPVRRHCRVLLTMSGGGGTIVTMRAQGGSVSTMASPEGGCMLCVEDVGKYVPQGGGYNTGGATAPAAPPKQQYVKTWTSTGATSYMGSGSKDSSQGASDMKQGYSSYDGNSRSMWFFPSMTSSIAGSTINKIRVYLYANHWYNNAGGTGYVKVHTLASAPGSAVTMTAAVTSTGWPKPGGRWVTLPTSLHAGFLAGTYKGIGVGPAPSNSTSYYGRFNRDGAKIEITYTK